MSFIIKFHVKIVKSYMTRLKLKMTNGVKTLFSMKKEEKKIRGAKSSTSLSQPLSTIEGYTITQNHSTGIHEEILVWNRCFFLLIFILRFLNHNYFQLIKCTEKHQFIFELTNKLNKEYFIYSSFEASWAKRMKQFIKWQSFFHFY